MAMSKKDFELLAACIADLSIERMTFREKTLVCRFALMINNRILERPDGRAGFDSQRFIKACKLPKVEGFNC